MTDLAAIQRAVDVALAVSRGRIHDVTGGALHYYNPHLVKPQWAKGAYKVIVGEHAFIRLAGK
jgi:spore germination cell wall hydrolase CwlJ-like protein